MKRKKQTWKPDFPNRVEPKIRMYYNKIETYCWNNQKSLLVTEELEQKSPACFWISPEEAYLRVNWHSWYQISPTNKNDLAWLGKLPAVSLLFSINNLNTSYPIPVYRVKELPQYLFDGFPQKQRRTVNVFPEHEIENSMNLCEVDTPDVTCADIPPVQNTISKVVRELQIECAGQNTHYFKHDNANFLLYESENFLYLIQAFDIIDNQNVWFACDFCVDQVDGQIVFDEDNGPLSPVYQIVKLQQKMQKELKRTIQPILVFDDTAYIIKIEDNRSWIDDGNGTRKQERLEIPYCFVFFSDKIHNTVNFETAMAYFRDLQHNKPNDPIDFSSIKDYLKCNYDTVE